MDRFNKIFRNGYGFEHFLALSDDQKSVDEAKRYLDIITQKIDLDLKDSIRAISGEIKILAFAEVWCSDCKINMAAIEMIEELSNSVQFKICGRTGTEDYIKEIIKKDKVNIPTVLVYKDDEFRGVFVERPQIVKEIETGDNQAKRIEVMKEYRQGLYMMDTIKEILEMIK